MLALTGMLASTLSMKATPHNTDLPAKEQIKVTVYGKGGIISNDNDNTTRVCPVSASEVCAYITVMTEIRTDNGYVWAEVRMPDGSMHLAQILTPPMQNSLQR